MKRRDFLLTVGIALMAASAYSFGESIKQLMNDKANKIALIYGTRYGATEDTAKWIAKGIGGSVDVLNIESIDLDEINWGFIFGLSFTILIAGLLSRSLYKKKPFTL